MSYNNLLTEKKDSILLVTINRPKQLNALNRETIQELSDLLDDARSDKTIRVLVITGSGEKSFVAGADIKEFADFSAEQGRELSADGHEKLFNKLENLGKPCIAAVNGFALGGGLELAMSAHIRIASDNARLGLPEVSLGVIPGYGGTQRLAHLVGKGKALEMISSAGMINAEDACSWGLVNKVVTQEELLPVVMKLASRISANSPTAISAALRSVLSGYEDGKNGLQEEIAEFGKCFGSKDFKEGTSAFLDKRKPEFKGE